VNISGFDQGSVAMQTVTMQAVDKLQKGLAEKIQVQTGYGGVMQRLRKMCDFFANYDAAGTGFLTRAEFHAAMAALNFVGCNLEISALFDRYDMDGTGRLKYKLFAEKLCNRVPDEAGDPNLRRIMAQLRQKIFTANGMYGIRMMQKEIAGADPEMNERELVHFFAHFGVRPDDKELAVVLTDFDPGGSHLVKLQSILLALNVSLTATRRTLLVKAFEAVASGGRATLSELQAAFDPTNMDAVQAREISVQQAKEDFLYTWNQSPGDSISEQDFVDYYKDISSLLDNDDDFEGLIRNNWQVYGGLDLTNNGLDSLEVTVTHLDGHQTTEYIAKDLGISQYDQAGLKAALRRQGVSPQVVEVHR